MQNGKRDGYSGSRTVRLIVGGIGLWLAATIGSPAMAADPVWDADRNGDVDLRDVAGWQPCYDVAIGENVLCDGLAGDAGEPIDLLSFRDFLQRMTGPRGDDDGTKNAICTNWADFPNGVASGDVDQSSVVLWARAEFTGTVRFEYGRDPTFAVIDGFRHEDVADPNIPAKVEIGGLLAGTQYYYRACLGDSCPSAGTWSCPDSPGSQAQGRFSTPFSTGYHGLRFGVSSCGKGDLRPFASIKNLPGRNLDFFAHLGDTVYADSPSDGCEPERYRCRSGEFRGEPCGPETCPCPHDGVCCAASIEEFRCWHRAAYSQHYFPEDNLMAAARASTAFFVTIDDHEVLNDFAGGAPPDSDDRFDQTGDFINETNLYKDAMQAFHEYNPIRGLTYPDDPRDRNDQLTANKPKLYRYQTFGNDAAIFVLDARSFRDKPVVDIPVTPPLLSYQRGRTMLGVRQFDELKDNLLNAQANGITWKFVLIPEPIQNLGPGGAADHFEGYAYERGQLLDFIQAECITNVVFISGDIHGTIVNNLAYKTGAFKNQRCLDTWDISTGPIAYNKPFGASLFGQIPAYQELMSRFEKDRFAEEAFNQLLCTADYPLVGLADDMATQLQSGSYMAVNTFGWTEFEIDAQQRLTVTTYGIPWYKDVDQAEPFPPPSPPDPRKLSAAEVLSLELEVVSQFTVAAHQGSCPGASDCQTSAFCLSNSDCCESKVCNFVVCVGLNSLPAFVPCSQNEACRSGSCNVVCGPECDHDNDCPGGFCAFGNCLTCVAENKTCVSNGQCCSGVCTGFPPKCQSCRGTLGRCDLDSECCGDVCNLGFCVYTNSLPNGLPCDKDAACRSGYCIAGVICGNCLEVGRPCLEANDCCGSNVCNLFFCVEPHSLPEFAPCSDSFACESNHCLLVPGTPVGACAPGTVCGDGSCDLIGGELCGRGNSFPACQDDCGLCPDGGVCNASDDCQSGYCLLPPPPAPQLGVCAPGCGNGSCDIPIEICGSGDSGPECQSDCGLCAIGLPCTNDDDCQSGNCLLPPPPAPQISVCVPGCGNSSCDFPIEICGSGNSGPECESDCGLCPLGFPCNADNDCQSGNCLAPICAPVCGDGFCDGTEICGNENSTLECRADCGLCPNGTPCVEDENCQSGICTGLPTPTCQSCRSDSSDCSSDGQCCSGICTGSPFGTCEHCRTNGSSCLSDGQCCSGDCVFHFSGSKCE